MDIHAIAQSVQSMLDPKLDNTLRSQCFKVVEDYKVNVFQFSDLPLLCSPGQHPAVILFGLQCLEHRIKHSWTDISPDVKREIKESLLKIVTDLDSLLTGTEENKVVPIILAQIFVHLIKLEWPQQWQSMFEDFLRLGEQGPSQARLVLSIFLRLYEDAIQFQNIPQSRRRDIVSSLNEKLLPLFSFALDLITSQLSSLETTPPSHQAITLCREAVLMLSGFLDTCRTDVLTAWRPRCAPDTIVADGTPFLQLLLQLISHEGTRIDSLSLLSLLLKRKSPASSGSSDESFNLIEILLRNDDAVNQLASIVCALVTEPPVFTEVRYNSLVLFAEVMHRLGAGLLTYWSELEPHANPCGCARDRQFCCSNRTTHLLDTITHLTTHPIRMVSAPLCAFWSSAFRCPENSLRLRLRPLCSTLFMTWRTNLLKDGEPSGSGLHNEWSRMVFEPEDWAAFFARFRIDVLRATSSAASCWPQDFMQFVSSWIETRTTTPFSPTDVDDKGLFTLATSPAVMDWDALDMFLEHGLAAVNEACQRDACHEQFLSTLTNWAQRFLQALTNVTDPNVRGKLFMCTSLVLQQMDASYDTQLLVPLLTQIFTSFRYVAPSESNSHPLSRPKCVKSMQLLAATAFFRFAKAAPERMMPHFQAVATEVASLWTESMCGVVEKSVLLESLISLCFRMSQPVSVQSDLLKQLLSGVLAQWSLTGSMGPLLRACAPDGCGLVTALGLDQSAGWFDAELVKTRITLTTNVLTLMAVVRRLAEPVHTEQIEQITVPLLEPVMPSVLMILRAFNELWQPETLNRVHPNMATVFELSDHVKACVLSAQTQRSSKEIEKTPLDRMRACIHECHDNLFHIVGIMFRGLRTRLYPLPTDRLAYVLHANCCAAFEHLPDLRLNNLIRTVIRPFIRYCPKEHLATALVPLLPPIIDALIQRLETRWKQLSALSQEECANQDAITEEVFKERLTRLLSRTLLDLMRFIYTFDGCDIQNNQTAPVETEAGDMEETEDVNMTGEVKSGAVVHLPGSVGSLAHLFADASQFQVENGCSTETTWNDTLFISSLVKYLTWPDSLTCLKAAQWIPPLIDLLTQLRRDGTAVGCNVAQRSLPAPLAENILFGVLCGLHVNANNVDSNVHALLAVGLRVYHTVELPVVQTNLHNLVVQALVSTEQATDAQQVNKIVQNVRAFEDKLFNNVAKPLAEKAKREAMKKLLQPLIGVPLSERFRDQVPISCLPPLARSQWRKLRRSCGTISGDLGLTDLFS